MGHEFDGKCGICSSLVMFCQKAFKTLISNKFKLVIILKKLMPASQTPQLRQIRHVWVPHLLVFEGILRNIA